MPLNPAAHLTSYGWEGPGKGLRPDSRAKPITVIQKKDNSGLGKDRDISFNWWENLFDNVVASTNKSGSCTPNGTTTTTIKTITGIISPFAPPISQPAEPAPPSSSTSSLLSPNDALAQAKRDAAKRSLYARFLRGRAIAGTASDDVVPKSVDDLDRGKVARAAEGGEAEGSESDSDSDGVEVVKVKKRKRGGESKEERRLRKGKKDGKGKRDRKGKSKETVDDQQGPEGSDGKEDSETSDRKPNGKERKPKKSRKGKDGDVNDGPEAEVPKKKKRKKGDRELEGMDEGEVVLEEKLGGDVEGECKGPKKKSKLSREVLVQEDSNLEGGKAARKKKRRRKDVETGGE